MAVSFVLRSAHRNPVLHLYRALLRHARVLAHQHQHCTPFTLTDAHTLRAKIRFSFRKHKGVVSTTQCRNLLASAHVDERRLRIAAAVSSVDHPTRRDALSRLHSDAVRIREIMESHRAASTYGTMRPFTDVEKAVHAEKQRRDAAIRLALPLLRSQFPQYRAGAKSPEEEREMAYELHLAQRKARDERIKRYRARVQPTPVLKRLQGPVRDFVLQAPFNKGYLAVFRNFARLIREGQNLIDETQNAELVAAYADAEDEWERDVEYKLTMRQYDPNVTFGSVHHECVRGLKNVRDMNRACGKERKKVLVRRLEYYKIEIFRNSPAYSRIFTFDDDTLIDEALQLPAS
ncbi:uncharacterized protein V1518DRAFT_419292 [Limtongia smithiae]|uniref:uncharacterized protein n=1 Tax=Limtongia smithiae TaxID=1125753 RepID=UPI0034CE8B06